MAKNVGIFDASTLQLMDGGKLSKEINESLRIAAGNTYEFGSDEKARKVVITIEMKLIEGSELALKGTVKASLPTLAGCTEVCKVDDEGTLFFDLPKIAGEESEAA